jgi:beta-fructofuranosidase
MNHTSFPTNNLMPPPKRLCRTDDGVLYLRTFEGFEEWIEDPVELKEPSVLKDSRGHKIEQTDDGWDLQSEFGFQAFLLDGPQSDFRLDCHLAVDGKGKCGFVFRIDEESHDGYYLALDLLKGSAQLRSWGTAREQEGEQMMSFKTLQSGNWVARGACGEDLSLIAFGSYIELSIGGRIVLSLADLDFNNGHLGIYADSCGLLLTDISLNPMRKPEQRDGQLIGS